MAGGGGVCGGRGIHYKLSFPRAGGSSFHAPQRDLHTLGCLPNLQSGDSMNVRVASPSSTSLSGLPNPLGSVLWRNKLLCWVKIADSSNHTSLSPTSAGACIHIIVSFYHSVRVKVFAFFQLPSRTLGSATELGCVLFFFFFFLYRSLTHPSSQSQWFWTSLPQKFHYFRIIILKISTLLPLTYTFPLPVPLCPMLLFSCVSISASYVPTSPSSISQDSLYLPVTFLDQEAEWVAAWMPKLCSCILSPFRPFSNHGQITQPFFQFLNRIILWRF